MPVSINGGKLVLGENVKAEAVSLKRSPRPVQSICRVELAECVPASLVLYIPVSLFFGTYGTHSVIVCSTKSLDRAKFGSRTGSTGLGVQTPVLRLRLNSSVCNLTASIIRSVDLRCEDESL